MTGRESFPKLGLRGGAKLEFLPKITTSPYQVVNVPAAEQFRRHRFASAGGALLMLASPGLAVTAVSLSKKSKLVEAVLEHLAVLPGGVM